MLFRSDIGFSEQKDLTNADFKEILQPIFGNFKLKTLTIDLDLCPLIQREGLSWISSMKSPSDPNNPDVKKRIFLHINFAKE